MGLPRRVDYAGKARARPGGEGTLCLGGDGGSRRYYARQHTARGDRSPHGGKAWGRSCARAPSAPGIALLRNSPTKVLDDLRARALPILCIAGLARLPQVSLPLAKLDGCPLGLSLIAARGNDTLLLELAGRMMAESRVIIYGGKP